MSTTLTSVLVTNLSDGIVRIHDVPDYFDIGPGAEDKDMVTSNNKAQDIYKSHDFAQALDDGYLKAKIVLGGTPLVSVNPRKEFANSEQFRAALLEAAVSEEAIYGGTQHLFVTSVKVINQSNQDIYITDLKRTIPANSAEEVELKQGVAEVQTIYASQDLVSQIRPGKLIAYVTMQGVKKEARSGEDFRALMITAVAQNIA